MPDSGSDPGDGVAGSSNAAQVVVVLSHPHPLYGGDMWNPLISDLFAALPKAGLATLRYNFRGVGASQGQHGTQGKNDALAEGVIAEVLDAEAAFAAASKFGAASETAPRVVSVGWSFGGDVSLTATHPALYGWVGIAAPLQIISPTAMAAASDERPKLLLVPENDEFCSPENAGQRSADWPDRSLSVISGADHFLGGHSAQVAELVIAFCEAGPK